MTPQSTSPAPTIRSLQADGATISLANPQLRPRVHTLAIEYGSASLRDAQRLNFRYRLDNYEAAWQQVGNRTTALYTDLPPGDYSFTVESSFDGLHWSSSAAPLALHVPPAFSQRVRVRLGGLALLVFVLWAYLRWRFAYVYRTAQLKLQARVQERERIARDLHDTLLQSVQGLILRFGAIADNASVDDAQRDNMQKALALAEGVITEGRDRVRDLRKQSDDANRLEECLVEAGTILALSSKSHFHKEVQGRKVSLQPLAMDELFMIGREALQNAFQHANAANVFLKLTYTSRDLTLTIKDDGKGLSADQDSIEKEGHWGVAGMRERAKNIGACFKLASPSVAGCTVTVVVSASLAFGENELSVFDWWAHLHLPWLRKPRQS